MFFHSQNPKILFIVFKYLGDVAITIPAMRAVKEALPGARLHMLVAEDALPLVKNLPWLEKTWGLPRKRGSARLGSSWPVLRALRHERFDCSIDFVGNDRGALVSLACGAKNRVGPLSPRGFPGRRFCYSKRIPALPENHVDFHESERHVALVKALGIPAPASLALELHHDPARDREAGQLLPEPAIICHLSTSQPKKEWPLSHWSEFHSRARAAGLRLVFASGPSPREIKLLADLQSLLGPAASGTLFLPSIPDLGLYLAVLKRASAFVSGDTGPLHFSAGLGVPTLGLFGPTPARQWTPLGPTHRHIKISPCHCSWHAATCTHPEPCIARITPGAALEKLREILPDQHHP